MVKELVELPHIAVGYSDGIPADTFDEFKKEVAANGLRLSIQSKSPNGPFAGVEEWLPTIVIIWIGKAYFDGFLKEASKDHYPALKAGFAKLYDRLASPQANAQVVVYGTKGKVREVRRYSLLYSIYAEADAGKQFKLLIPLECTKDEYVEIVAAYLTFLDAYHAGTLERSALDLLQNTRRGGGTLLLVFNHATKRIEPYDPRP
jgi:hypothetical protein